MSGLRTTVSLEPQVYDAARNSYKRLGFCKLGDLINVALKDYLHRRDIEDKLLLLEEAASDPSYVRLVRDIGKELSVADADGLTTEY